MHALNSNIFTRHFELVDVLDRYPFPVSHPIESNLRVYGNSEDHHWNISDSQIPQGEFPIKKVTLKAEPMKHDSSHRSFDDRDWCGKSKTVLFQLVARLKKITTKKIRSDNQVQNAQEEIKVAINQADLLAPTGKSALHLALFWIEDYIFTKRSISPQTVGAYFSRVFYNGLLSFPDSDDLGEWEDEDHEIAFEKAICRDNFKTYPQKVIDTIEDIEAGKKGPSKRTQVISTYKQVYAYANRHGFSENIKVSFLSDDWAGGTTRNKMIGLYQFDALVQRLWTNDYTHKKLCAVASILAFYGSLRAGEVSKLTLNDVIIDHGEVYVEILSGKTPAARRRIPLHLLAPEACCEMVKTFYNIRLKQFKRKCGAKNKIVLRNIALFGPDRTYERYQRRSIIDVTINELKYFLGEDFVFHSLRHSFASWLLLRWYANRYHDFPNLLQEGGHLIFNEVCQKKLLSLFTADKDSVPGYNTSDLVIFSKLIGHSGQETMFSTYIHSFSAIHKHAIERMSDVFGQQVLDGKTIAALVPKMSSRTSQAKLKDKSINSIISFLS